MKSTFSLNPFIGRMLETAGYDVDRVTNSVQSALNDSSLVKEESKRGNVSLVAKGTEYKVSESTRADYTGKTTAPIAFSSWHDAQAAVFKKHGDPSAEIPPAVLPAHLVIWLVKFQTVKVMEAPAEPTEAKGKGKGQRNGNLESVPTPEPAK